MLSPFVSTRMLKETRVFLGLPLLLLHTVMRLENEKVVGRGGVSEWRLGVYCCRQLCSRGLSSRSAQTFNTSFRRSLLLEKGMERSALEFQFRPRIKLSQLHYRNSIAATPLPRLHCRNSIAATPLPQPHSPLHAAGAAKLPPSKETSPVLQRTIDTCRTMGLQMGPNAGDKIAAARIGCRALAHCELVERCRRDGHFCNHQHCDGRYSLPHPLICLDQTSPTYRLSSPSRLQRAAPLTLTC